MKTVNSLSGGKTSSYLAVHYPADYNIFALVRTENKNCLFKDKKVRQIISDRINNDFVGTLEDDLTIYTILELEQYIGKEIIIVSPLTFEEAIRKHNNFLPNIVTRYCTTDLKVIPIANWCYENTDLPVEMRIGFRANEVKRANRLKERQIDGIENFNFIIGKNKSRNKWANLPYRKVTFPLIENNIYKDTIVEYWENKPVKFAFMNNCVGCFHRNELLLKYMSEKNEKQFNVFMNLENEKATFKKGITYKKIKEYNMQFNLFEDDFNECDSGYCGL